MGIMRQLGDPLAGGACLCQHHGAAYAKYEPPTGSHGHATCYYSVQNNTAITQATITITDRCCIAVSAATLIVVAINEAQIEIERPQGTIRTTQTDAVISKDVKLMHHAAWETLDPGTYTYYLMNRTGATIYPFATWIKIIASDCEG